MGSAAAGGEPGDTHALRDRQGGGCTLAPASGAVHRFDAYDWKLLRRDVRLSCKFAEAVIRRRGSPAS
jgi:hypothetical protein